MSIKLLGGSLDGEIFEGDFKDGMLNIPILKKINMDNMFNRKIEIGTQQYEVVEKLNIAFLLPEK